MVGKRYGAGAEKLHTTSAAGEVTGPQGKSHWKISDNELNWMTTKSNNPTVMGVFITPYKDVGNAKDGNLVRTNAGNPQYPINGSNQPNMGVMAKYVRGNPEPTVWGGTNDNTHCGGKQIWSNWTHPESHHFRFNNVGGCGYMNADHINDVPSSGNWAGDTHVTMYLR